jgi:hypothetical protein
VTGRSERQAGPGTRAKAGAGERARPAEPGRVRARQPRPAPGSGRTGTGGPGTARRVSPGSTARPVSPGSTGRTGTGRPGTGRPGTGRPGTGRPGTGRPGPRRPAGAGTPGGLRLARRGAVTRTSSRTSFIVLVVGLLGGGLLSLLLINTVLAAGSYQISALQHSIATQTQQVATLRQQVAADRSPAIIERRALQLGMVAPPLIKFLNLKTGRVTSQPATDKGIPAVPGWTP